MMWLVIPLCMGLSKANSNTVKRDLIFFKRACLKEELKCILFMAIFNRQNVIYFVAVFNRQNMMHFVAVFNCQNMMKYKQIRLYFVAVFNRYYFFFSDNNTSG